DVARLLDRLAVVERFEDGEFATALLDGARDAEQVLAAFGAGHRRPRPVERPACSTYRIVDVGRAGLGDLGERLLVRRVDRLDGLAAAVAESPVDEDLIA